MAAPSAQLTAARASEEAWLQDLSLLLREARARFGDLAWHAPDGRTVYAHKAVVYSRAAGSFQQRFLGTPAHANQPELAYDPLQFLRPASIASSHSLATPRDLDGTDPAFFDACLEFLYTGTQGMEAVFSVLFDGFEEDQNGRGGGVQRLRQDLLYAWRSKLFADVHLVVDNGTGDPPTAFASHRAILASRSPYFHALLLGNFQDSSSTRFTLPSPPFTPAATNFVLGWIYSGTLDFSNRTFDLGTAFDIWRCAAYLSLVHLQHEVEIKIEGMLTLKRAGRIYSFSLAPDVNSLALQRAAGTIVVDHFGDIWNSPTVGNLEFHQQERLVSEVCAKINAACVTAVAKDSFTLRKRIELDKAGWASHVAAMLDAVDDRVRQVLGGNIGEVVLSPAFVDLIDGIGFSTDALAWLLELVVGGLSESNAASVYQALVGSVLLRDEGILMDAKLLCEDTKSGVLRFLKSRWMGVRSSRGFDRLESWCLKELSDELEVSIEDLLAGSPKPVPITSRSGLRVTARKAPVEETSSARAAVASRAAARAASIGLRSAQAGPSAPRVVARVPVPGANPVTRLTSTVRSASVPRPAPSTPVVAGSRIRQDSAASTARSTLATRSLAPVPNAPTSPPKPTRVPPPPPSTSAVVPVASASLSPKYAGSPRVPPLDTASRRAPSLTSAVRAATSPSTSSPRAPVVPRTPIARPLTTSTSSIRTPIKTVRPTTSMPSVAAARAGSVASTRTTPALRKTTSSASIKSVRSVTESIRSVPPLPSRARPLPINTTPAKSPASTSTLRAKAGGRTVDAPVDTSGSDSTLKQRTPAQSAPASATVFGGLSPVPKAPVSASKALPGSTLLAGIECIVTTTGSLQDGTTSKAIRFKATVRYLGLTLFPGGGQWVGVEVLEGSIADPEDEASLDWNDGAVAGVQYFVLRDPNDRSSRDVSRSNTPISPGSSAGGRGVSLAPPGRRPRRSTSSSDAGEQGVTRGLFVRPDQIVYVL